MTASTSISALLSRTASTTFSAKAASPLRWAVVLLVCAAFSFGSRGTTAGTTPDALAHAAAAAHFTIADFDGDNRPDLATIETGLIGASHARYWIDFRMSAGSRQSIGVNAPAGGLEIASRDVNGDNIVDLIVSTAWLKQPVAILVNDGHGNFSVTDPAKFSAVFANLDQAFSAPSSGIKESSAALLTRINDDCSIDASDNEITAAPSAPLAQISQHRVFPLAVSVLGRAPPLSVHCV
jgi:hypothetical protein